MSIPVKGSDTNTYQVQQASLGEVDKSLGVGVTLAPNGSHAKTADITSLSAAITGALAPSGGLPVALQGTVAVTQSGAWTVGLTPGATVALAGGNTVALKVDGSAVTQPVSGTVTVGALPALAAGTSKIGSVDVASLPATVAQDASLAKLDADLNAGLGTDGTTPPSLPGGATGVRGWLRYLASLLPASLGAKLAAASLSIAPATDAVFATAPQAAIPNKAASGALTNSGDTVQVAVAGMATAVIQITYPAGATGTAVFEASADGGASWAAVNMIPYVGGAPAVSATASGLFEMACGGLDFVRVRASTAIASGPLAVVARATAGAKSIRVGNPVGNPLTNSEQPVQGIIDMPTAATAYTAGRAVEIVCSTAGALTLTYADGSTRTRTFSASTTPAILSGAVTQWSLPSGSTFAGTVCNLK